VVNTLNVELLVADDDLITIERIKDILNDYTYKNCNGIYKLNITTVNDGMDAFNALLSGKYDLAILDYRMPGKTGLEVSQAIRDKYPFIPIIIISNYEIDCKAAMEAGVIAYESKESLNLTKNSTFFITTIGNVAQQNGHLIALLNKVFKRVISYRHLKNIEEKVVKYEEAISELPKYLKGNIQ